MHHLTYDATITHPCGHTTDFHAACTRPDHFTCPQCGLDWHIHSSPPETLPSGYIAPGKRTVILHTQLSLPQLATA
jgi:hypothetical protein